jgi:DNA repair exonuclease SbcCD ATPase subunit
VKKIQFNFVKIQNFLSIGKDPIFIDFQKGITVITGENKDKGGKNGIGKSTIADGIFWCLFGNTIRELKKDKIQHNKNKEDCKVVLCFKIQDTEKTINYKITRTLEPSKIEILREDEDITLSTLPKNDEFIKNLIGANEEVFNNAVIMSANNTIPFMAQKKTEKRKFIEGILQLNIFSEMLLKTRSEYNDLKKENDINSSNFINEQKILTILNDNKVNFDESKNNRIKLIETKIESHLKDIESLKDKEIADSKVVKIELDEYREKEQKLNELQAELNREIVKLTTQKTQSEMIVKQKDLEQKNFTKKGTICPTCNRKYCSDDIDHVTAQIKKIKQELKEENTKAWDIGQIIKQKNELISKICKNKNKIQQLIDNCISSLRESSLHEEKILNFVNKNLELKNDIEIIKKESFKDDAKIIEIEKNIQKLEESLKDIKKSLSILDTVKFIVSEEGVKTYIVKKIINILNTKLNYYLQTLDAPCKCVFDEMFEETIYNDQGKECSYFNFSGGERKRIDTAILFTFQDVMRFHSGTSFSLNIYDELFDCALDVKGTDKILEILKEKVEKYDETIYIVSHKHSEISNIDNVIFLEKSNGVTKIVN